MRIVNQPFPANGGAGFFKIDAHDQIEAIADLFGKGFKTTSVLNGGFRIVNRTRTTYHQQARIATGDDVRDGLTRLRDLRFLLNAQREFSFQLIRRDQNLFVSNMYVIQRVFLHDCDPV